MNHLLNQLLPVWPATRAAGLTSYVLLFLSVVSGILQSLPGVLRRRRATLYALHCTACQYGLLFGFLHGLLMLGDTTVSYTWREILVPFTAPYLPLATGLGTIALYIMVVLVISSRLIKRIGRKFWRVVHFLAFPGYLLALYHGIAMGTDAQYAEIRLLYAITAAVVLVLVLFRLSAGSAKKVPVSGGRGPARDMGGC